ncbi:MAG: tol-pal system protein YbgF [Desulfovibrio sp.]|nr:tol-pal system protein YbgF [Desulfovibrio sp.]
MKHTVMASLICMALMAGCAGSRQAESLENEQKLLRENEQRLRALEQSLSALDSHVAQLDNRVYEVRTSKGKKTGMTVVPVLPPTSSVPAAAQTTKENSLAMTANGPAHKPAVAPHARVVDPAQPTRSASPQRTAQRINRSHEKASASAPASAVSAPALPPASVNASAPLGLPPESVPASSGRSTAAPMPASANGNAVPVPKLSDADLGLPPERSGLGLPPVEAAQKPGVLPIAEAPVGKPAAARQQTPVARRSSGGEDAAYKEAVRSALAGRSGESISRFHTFLQNYPNGRYAANAEYWIGEGYYAQGKYNEALAQFEKVNARYPRHHKNADALLKAGVTMSKMGNQAGASEAFRKLLTQFPNSDAAKRVRSRGLAH